MITLIIVLHIIIGIFMVGVILLQPGKSDSGIGFGSTSQSIFGSRGAGNILTHATAIAATLFLVTSFLLAKHQVQHTSGSVMEGESAAPEVPAQEKSVPSPTPGQSTPAPDAGKAKK